MSITYQETTVQTVTYGETSADTVTYDETLVFQRSGSVLINEGFSISVSSVVPPPYDENGYNYDDEPPNVIDEEVISLGDISGYDYITFDWNNTGSYSPFGYVEAKLVIGDDTIIVPIFNSAGESNGTKKVDISNLSGSYAAHFVVRAQSRSPYMYYGTRTTLNVSNICGVIGEESPSSDLPDFSMGRISSYAPPPYRGSDPSEWYNIYGDNGDPVYETYTLNLGDVTQYNTFTFTWSNIGENTSTEFTSSGYGSRVMAKYHDPVTDRDVSLFDHTTYSGEQTGTVTIDISGIAGQASILFTIGAISGNDYAGYGANTYLKVSNITLS